MDEVTMVREFLAEPPAPSPQVARTAWEALDQQMQGHPLPGRRTAPANRMRPLPGRRTAPANRMRPLLAAGLAAGVAAAITVGALSAGGGPARTVHPVAGGGASVTGRPARAFLLAVATRVGHGKPAGGRYWCQGAVSGQIDPIGPGGQELTPPGQGLPPSPVSDYRYSIFARELMVDCFKPSSSDYRNLGGYFQNLGAQPATAKDAAAWRRDGSPAWHAWYGNKQLIPAQAGPRARTSGKRGRPPWGSLASLPASPAKLRKVLEGSGGPDNANLFLQAQNVLQESVRPAVRAAAYRLLASIPGVRMKPGVMDPSGRPGTALWYRASHPSWIIIVDPATGMLLADEWIATCQHGVYAPGTMTQYMLWQTPVWTNRLPR